MHLITILAYVFLFWRAEMSVAWSFIGQDDVMFTVLFVFIQPLILGLLGIGASRRVHRLLRYHSDSPQKALYFHHQSIFLLRLILLIGFGLSVLFTPWPDVFSFGRLYPPLQIASDLIVLSPYFLGALVLWFTAYPVERSFKALELYHVSIQHDQDHTFRLSSYLDFNFRHHILVVAVPMTLILFTANITRSYDSQLRGITGLVWTSDAVLAIVAAAIFVLSPLLLRRIWRTEPLEDGPLRQRLEHLCRKTGMQCRDILIWKSGGMMINAAVMGMIAPIRYVLLSDALLSSMDTRQIEAVFGHEAGHIKHRHIQQFLMLAFIGWLIAVGIMELLAGKLAGTPPSLNVSLPMIQGIGIAATVLFWGIAFGWVSRRFERQADMFGAQCVTPSEKDCLEPCAVHQDDQTIDNTGHKVCVTGAAVFVSALDRVAVLNAIPREERSWRHSSIGSRMRFLMSLAGDPQRAEHFNRVLRRIRLFLWIGMLVGLTAGVIFWSTVS